MHPASNLTDAPTRSPRRRLLDSAWPAFGVVLAAGLLWTVELPEVSPIADPIIRSARRVTLLALAVVAWAMARQAALPSRAKQAERRVARAVLPVTLCPHCLHVARGLPHSCWRCESTDVLPLEDEDARARTVAQLSDVADHLGR